MASAMRKMAVYLGLVEDDHRYPDGYDAYGEYEEYEEPADVIEAAPVRADYGGYVRRDPGSSPRRRARSSWPGSPHSTRAPTMKPGPSVSTSAKAPR